MSPKAVATRRGRMLLSAIAFVAAFSTLLVFAYAPFQDQVDGAPVPTRWPFDPTGFTVVTWSLYPTIGTNVDVTSGANPVSVPEALTGAFEVWQQTQLNGQILNSLVVERGSNASVRDPDFSDCENVISFSPSSAVSFSTGEIAFTQIASATPPPGAQPPYNYPCNIQSNLPSVIVDADMIFNPNEPFSTSTPRLPARFDVQSTAGHEFGHLLGLDHSGIAHTMMFPFGDVGAGQQRDLAVDDVVGVAFLYPAATFTTATGAVSGKITLNGFGIFAAHVVAVDAVTGAAVVDGLTNPDGTYTLDGVPPGTYNVFALPLSGVYTLDSFSGWVCGYASDPNTCAGIPQNPTDYSGKFF